MKKLPDAEFELMRIIWANPAPISTNRIIDQLDSGATWKPQTVLTLLSRLTERGFLQSCRHGRERYYEPLVSREEYLAFESGQFMERYHANSFISLFSTLYESRHISPEELRQIRQWLDEKE